MEYVVLRYPQRRSTRDTSWRGPSPDAAPPSIEVVDVSAEERADIEADPEVAEPLR